MARAPLFRTSKFAYHVTSRSNNKEWFYLPIAECWEIFCTQLALSAASYRVLIHAFVLMDNHFHMIATTLDSNLDVFMSHALSGINRVIQRRTDRINHIFGARYHRSVLDSATSLAYAYKYLVRNPVRAGLSSAVEEYSFSSLNRPESLPVAEGFSNYWMWIPRDPAARLNWANQPTPKEHEEMIRRALKRKVFKLSTDSNSQAIIRAMDRDYLRSQNEPPGTF